MVLGTGLRADSKLYHWAIQLLALLGVSASINETEPITLVSEYVKHDSVHRIGINIYYKL